MFQISCVHHQEDHLYLQFFIVCFLCIYVSSLAGEGCARYCKRTLKKWQYLLHFLRHTEISLFCVPQNAAFSLFSLVWFMQY